MPVYAHILLPLSLTGEYTYQVPPDLLHEVQPGKRVEVQFGQKRIYAGIVKKVFEGNPPAFAVKPILNVLDEQPMVTGLQLQFWQWLADYYLCAEGDVMNTALPSAFKLSSETKLEQNPTFNHDYSLLTDEEFMVAEAFTNHPEITLADVQQIVNRKNVMFLVKSLLEKGVIFVKEELVERYKPKTETVYALLPQFEPDDAMHQLFNSLERAPKQLAALMAYIQVKNESRQTQVTFKELQVKAPALLTPDVKALVKKGIFGQQERIVSRIPQLSDLQTVSYQLSGYQQNALREIKTQFTDKQVVLLHGVTSSGKTQLYIQLIQEMLSEGRQTLYLMPEIALTAQMISRLRKVFGNEVGIYHSKFNDQERIEIWHKVLRGEYKLVLGARSALFLPFQNLGLLIVDEEHDTSFKQYDPAPRYHARDSAIYLASLFGAKTLLGSATPSVESYYNAVKLNKYGLVTLTTRYGNVEPPVIEVVNLRQAAKENQLQSHFSSQLLHEIKEALHLKEQVILFQNRRGYAPHLSCEVCGWIPQCPHCDVSLTYHKYIHQLKCHYCGYKTNAVVKCKACNSTRITQHGFGTEKVEDELQNIFPQARIDRLDLEVARTKTGFEKIIHNFEQKETDILVGTQMVTKGLDFDNVNMVGILSADQLLFFPDFRSSERAFQLMLQVSGRAGRRNKQGKVLIQTKNPNYPVINYVLQNNYTGFFNAELAERLKYNYPPFSRLIAILLKHTDKDKVNNAAFELAAALKKNLGNSILGPALPAVARVRNHHLRQILVKLGKNSHLAQTKQYITQTIAALNADKNYKSVIVQIDVDPY
ncbi:primosomal protein N' [Sphingobacteriales bacterium UPWRP_1]|nr:primosomal protein N' [Sphingobacteriales bacterium TSM_CSM]PSJ72051.1 primosomal protein N' [Sphingobacteriales bacterium UPWRP_1]